MSGASCASFADLASSASQTAGRALAVVDCMVSRRRTALVLVLAYGFFFFKMYNEGSAPELTRVAGEVNGAHLMDASVVEPLTRATALASAASSQRSVPDGRKERKAGKPGMRRETAGRRDAATSQEAESGPDGALEDALRRAGENPDPRVRAQLTATIRASLGNMHSARADYTKAAEAMELGVQAAGDGAEGAVGEAIAVFAQLELRHQRYTAAERRFGDALMHANALSTETLVSSTCGLGWALLMQGRLEPAATHLRAALERSDRDSDTEQGCVARHDGLDAQRVVALAGLSVADGAGRAERIACADLILRGKAVDLQEPWPRQALGLAFLSLGNARAARGHQARAVQLEAQRGGSEVDLTSGARGLLYLGLAKFADTANATHAAAQASHVQALAPDGPQAAEIGELLARFAGSHAPLLVGQASRMEIVELFMESATKAFENSGDEARLALHRSESAEVLRSIRAALENEKEEDGEVLALQPEELPANYGVTASVSAQEL